MNIIKRHKGLAVLLGLALILIAFIGIILFKMVIRPKSSVYGDRLNGISEIDKAVMEEVVTATEEMTAVEEADIRVQGRIVYTTIYFVKGTKVATAKEIAGKTLSYYDEENIEDYDFAFFLVENVGEDDEAQGFIIAGEKHPNLDSITYTDTNASSKK